MANLINAQGNVLTYWNKFLSNDMTTQKARIWRINRGKSMLMKITYAIARNKKTLEDEGISPTEIE